MNPSPSTEPPSSQVPPWLVGLYLAACATGLLVACGMIHGLDDALKFALAMWLLLGTRPAHLAAKKAAPEQAAAQAASKHAEAPTDPWRCHSSPKKYSASAGNTPPDAV